MTRQENLLRIRNILRVSDALRESIDELLKETVIDRALEEADITSETVNA